MAYSIKVDRVGECGTSRERIANYTAETEIEAVTIAVYEVDVYKFGPQRIAVISDATGRLVLLYAGRARTSLLL